jgi:pimeloyl-ACP methyl ester carboxylesterase
MGIRLYEPLALNSLKCGLSTAWGAGCETLSIDDQQGTDYAIVAIPIAGFVQPSLFIDMMTSCATQTLFLPGAGGSASFWKPVADLAGLDGVFFGWPGLGDEPANPQVNGLDDLVDMVLDHVREPVNIVAQSMGGLIAIRLALARPMMVKRLVLVVTSGGVPVADLGGSDWRADYFAAYPGAASWIAHPTEDLSDRIPSIDAAALLIWGDNDPISPIAVGERLSALFPNAQLCIIPGADHDLAQTHAEIVANMIERHLSAAM